jgi:hypothetical protein
MGEGVRVEIRRYHLVWVQGFAGVLKEVVLRLESEIVCIE